MSALLKKKEKRDLLSLVDAPLLFTREKRPENGEDCASYICHTDGAYFAVFDGCGGAGAQHCPHYGGKTEAYIASRAAADVFESWFDAGNDRSAESLKSRLRAYLTDCYERVGEESVLMGGLRKKFPTAAAAGICRLTEERLTLDVYWAGDSRVYLLDAQGLAQLTEDDLGGIDAMENLTRDGALTNLINLSRDFTLHTARLRLVRPALVFAATDGCFGYLSTPMEFEYLLLSTLLNADGISDWLGTLRERIDCVSGDDFSISGYALGFGSFPNTKQALIPRANALYESCIRGLKDKSPEEKQLLWQTYRVNYERLLCRVQGPSTEYTER